MPSGGAARIRHGRLRTARLSARERDGAARRHRAGNGSATPTRHRTGVFRTPAPDPVRAHRPARGGAGGRVPRRVLRSGHGPCRRRYLRGLYGTIKSCGAYIEFAFLTGVSKFHQGGPFSDLNNLIDLTLDPRYATICGYTDADLDTVFAPELDGLDRDAIRDWYNGYHWRGDEKVYNPFDILLLFEHREFAPHWFETGSPAFLVETLEERGVGARRASAPIRLDRSPRSRPAARSRWPRAPRAAARRTRWWASRPCQRRQASARASSPLRAATTRRAGTSGCLTVQRVRRCSPAVLTLPYPGARTSRRSTAWRGRTPGAPQPRVRPPGMQRRRRRAPRCAGRSRRSAPRCARCTPAPVPVAEVFEVPGRNAQVARLGECRRWGPSPRARSPAGARAHRTLRPRWAQRASGGAP